MGASLVYLDRPRTVKHTVTGESTTKHTPYSFALSSMQGWRLSQEDAHICNANINGEGIGLFAVFDGHGGIEVAKYCERHFTEILLAHTSFKNEQY
jgi:serine/threonine protein phosphatase PrpC